LPEGRFRANAGLAILAHRVAQSAGMHKEIAMNAIASIVPGFNSALGRAPVTLATHHKLVKAREGAPLSARSRAQIGLAIAQQLRCEYCVWVQSCLAEAAGLSGEDIFMARAGTALVAHEAHIVKLACSVVSGGVFRNRLDPEATRGLEEAEAAAVVTEVAFAIVNCYVVQSIAPATRDTLTRRAG
jgi:AhpD family alkylhydroperoxidase